MNEIKKENEEEDQEMQGEEPDEQHQEHQQGQDGKVDRMCEALQKNGGALWSGGKGHWSKTSTYKDKNKGKGEHPKGMKGGSKDRKDHKPQRHRHHQHNQQGAPIGTGKGYNSMTNQFQAGGYGRRSFGWNYGRRQMWYRGNSSKEARGSWN